MIGSRGNIGLPPHHKDDGRIPTPLTRLRDQTFNIKIDPTTSELNSETPDRQHVRILCSLAHVRMTCPRRVTPRDGRCHWLVLSEGANDGTKYVTLVKAGIDFWLGGGGVSADACWFCIPNRNHNHFIDCAKDATNSIEVHEIGQKNWIPLLPPSQPS